MTDASHDSDALKVDIRVSGHGFIARLINRVVTFKQWFWPLRVIEPYIPKWVTPNGITIFRILLTIPIVWLVLTHHPVWAFLVVVGAAKLDFFDGWLAEVRNLRTPLGTILDPIGDKIMVVAVLGAQLFLKPPPYAVVVMCAMIAIELGIQTARLRRMREPESGVTDDTSRAKKVAAKWPGKMKMVCESVALAVFTLAPLLPNALWIIGSILLIPAIVFSIYSLASQLRD